MSLATVLKAELLGDPAGRGYSGKTTQAQADLLNAPYTITVAAGVAVQSDIACSAIEMIIVPTGEMFSIQTLANKPLTGGTMDQAIGAAWSFLQMVSRWATIQTSIPAIWTASQSTLSGLQSAGVLSAASIAAITAQVMVTAMPVITHHHPRTMEIYIGITGAPNALSAADVTGALAS